MDFNEVLQKLTQWVVMSGLRVLLIAVLTLIALKVAKFVSKRLLKKRFDEEGIEIPFPHVTLYIGQDKQGDLPPLNVSLSGEGTARQSS